MSKQTPSEVHAADPSLRRQLIIVLLLSILIGAAALFALQWWLQSLQLSHDPDQLALWLRRLMGGAIFIIGSSLAAGAYWLQELSESVRNEGRWPPADLRTAHAMPIQRGSEAAATARQFLISSYILAAIAVLSLLWALWLGWPGLR